MMKTNDPMYANHNGWVYKKYVRSDENAEYIQVIGSNLEDAGVTLTIYAVNGHGVRKLTLGHQPAGIYQNRSRAAY